jgi:predicted acyl esterase
MEVKFSHERVGFEAWPSAHIATTDLYLSPRSLVTNGRLETVPSTRTETDSIWSGLDSGATTGVPALSPLLEATLDVPVTVWTSLINRVNGIVYDTAELTSDLKLRGASRLSVWIAPSLSQAELVAYLYDEDALGKGTLITHGVRSLHDAVPGQEIEVPIDFVATAYDVPAGHRIAIAIDTHDALYGAPTKSLYRVDFHYSEAKQSVLTLSHAE